MLSSIASLSYDIQNCEFRNKFDLFKMNNYRKGKNIEEPLEKNKIPFIGLPENFLWMQVRGGSKIRNLLSHALEEFPQKKHIVWTGFGPSVGKAITCAEIMKKEWDNSLYQNTKICYRLIEEYWDPLLPELDQLIVKRKLPMIHIYLSIEPLNKDELGYQAPGETTPYKLSESNFQEQRGSNNKISDKRGHTLGEFVSHKLNEGTSNKTFKYKSKEKKTVPESVNEKLTANSAHKIREQIVNVENNMMNNNKLSSHNSSERSRRQENLEITPNQSNSKKNKKQRFQENSTLQHKPKNSQGNSDISDNVDFKSSHR